MFHNDEPPVSLFSFQDIITSLTGIMVFFMLLLSLNILEQTKKMQDQSPVYKELEQVQEKNKILKKQISEIIHDLKHYKQRIKVAQQKDEAALQLEKYRLEEKLKKLKYQKGDFDKKLQEEKEKYARLEQQRSKLEKEQDATENEIRQMKNLIQLSQQKKQQIAMLRKEIARRRKEVEVTVASSINKSPVLIECSKDKICIVNRRENSKRDFKRKTPILSELVEEAIAYLKLFSTDKFYFVLMLKPSAVEYFDFFKTKILSEIKNAECGYEPIKEHEVIANE